MSAAQEQPFPDTGNRSQDMEIRWRPFLQDHSALHALARFLHHAGGLDRMEITLHANVFSVLHQPVLIQIKPCATGAVRIFLMSARSEVHVPLDLKLVAKIGSSVAVASIFGLLLVLIAVSDEKASGYGQIVGAFGLARDSVGPAMLVFGLALVGFAGIVAWLYSLHTSFRIAGPLYRMSRDLELQIEHGAIAPMPIRAGDSLQREWKAFEASVAALREQHEELRQALKEVEKALRANTATADAGHLVSAIARLKTAEQRVHL